MPGYFKYQILLSLVATLLLTSGIKSFAQVPTVKDTTESGEIEILFQQKLRTVIKDGREINHFQGDVVFKHDDAYIFCDTGTKEDKIIRAWGNVVIKQGDTLNIFSDKLYYDGNTKIADLERNVVLENRDQKLFTRKLKYDVANKVATYQVGATLTDNKTYLRSKRGTYFARTSDAFFKDSVVVLDPEFSMKTDTLKYNTKSKIATFLAPTLITYDKSRIYTEAGFYEIDNKYAVFSKNPQYLSDQQRSRADTIYYLGMDKKVRLEGKAVFEEEDKIAKADTIIFFEETNIVELINNARYRETARTATGEYLIYDRGSKQFKSPKRVVISDPPQILEADSLDFDNDSGLGLAFGQIHWQDTAQKMQIFCEEALYNKSEDYIKAWGGRPLLAIEIDSQLLFVSGDTLLSYKIARADLNMEPVLAELDSLENQEEDLIAMNTTSVQEVKPDKERLTPIAEKSQSKDPKKAAPPGKQTAKKKGIQDQELERLYEHTPIVEKDTSFVGFEAREKARLDSLNATVDTMSIDSLAIIPELETTTTSPDTVKILLVYHDVKIYREDMRGVCDSLSFNTLDSIFTFFRNPIIWSDSTQFTGDTITMIVKDKKMHRMDLLTNALILSSPNEVYFDQIRGKIINAYFKDSGIDNVLVTGNAETVYYALDKEGAYNGVNSKQASKMRIFFQDKQMQNIRFYSNPAGRFYPMGKADHEGMKLKGFKWQMELRPEDFESITNLEWIPWDLLIPPPVEEDPETPEEGEEEETDPTESMGDKSSPSEDQSKQELEDHELKSTAPKVVKND